MKIKSKFAIYNIIMLITPILLIGVISVCFVLIFILKFPVEELNISRPSMFDPYVFSQAVGEFFKSNPSAIFYVVLWLTICVLFVVLSTTVATRLMTKSIEHSINDLAKAGNEVAKQIMDDAKEYLANFIGVVYGYADPEIVILGGSVALKIDGFVEEVEALAKERVYEIMKPYVKVRKSTLNEDSGLIGAAYLAFSKAE